MVKYGEAYIAANSSVAVSAIYSSTGSMFDFHVGPRFRVEAKKNPVYVEAEAQLLSFTFPSIDAIKYREIKLASADLLSISDLTTAPEVYVQAYSNIGSTSTFNKKECYNFIYNIRRMSTPYVEGRTYRYELTDGFVYDSQAQCYSNPKTIFTFKVPYTGQIYTDFTFTQDLPSELSRIRYADSTFTTDINLVAPPYNFTKASADLNTIISLLASGIMNPGDLASIVLSLGTLTSDVKITRDMIATVLASISSQNIQAKVFRTITANLDTIASISAKITGIQRIQTSLPALFSLISDIKKLTPVPIDPIQFNFSTVNTLDRIRNYNIAATAQASITAESAPGPFEFYGTYTPNDGGTLRHGTLYDDYSLVLTSNNNVELVTTSTLAYVRTFTMPSLHVPIKEIGQNGFFYNERMNSYYRASANYVACLTDDGTNRYIEVFNKLTGTWLYSLSSNNTVGRFNSLEITDTMIAVTRGITNNAYTYNKLEFYNITDGSSISTYTSAFCQYPIVGRNGRFLFPEDEGATNPTVRVYDINSSLPSYLTRRFRSYNCNIRRVSDSYFSVSYHGTIPTALTDGTRNPSFDFNNLNTVLATTPVSTVSQPEIKNIPMSQIHPDLDTTGEIISYYMSDDYIFISILTAVTNITRVYIIRISDAKRMDNMDFTNAIIRDATNEYLLIGEKWYRNTVN